jgi:hypothetical protein
MQRKTGLHRVTTDVFYTKPEIAQVCLDRVRQHCQISSYDLILEPSAGSGAFSNLLLPLPVVAYDIAPAHCSIQQADFLTVSLDLFQNKRVLVVGNPPFGRQSSLAKKFIRRSATIAQTIAFILPKSFKKESLRITFPLNFHLIDEMDLPVNSFTVEERPHDVPCVFQIWDRRDHPREIPQKVQPQGFVYVKTTENPDFSLRRVGVYAGTLSDDLNKSVESHYFIRLNHEVKEKLGWKEEFIRRFNQHVFDHNNTVGAKSISKQEFTAVINRILQ